LQLENEFDDAATIRATIDVITEKDEFRSLRSRVALALFDQALKLVSAAMYVPNCVNVGHASSLPWL
jgi:hypothetical protein